MAVKEEVSLPSQRICVRCKFVSSQEVCKACVLLEGLNKGLPRLGIGKSSKAKKMLEEYNAKQPESELDKAMKDLNDEPVNTKSKGRCKSKVKNKENCGNCSGKCAKETNEAESNSKINNLLEQYGLENTQNVPVNGHADKQIPDEDDGCSGSCGKLGSMQIGF